MVKIVKYDRESQKMRKEYENNKSAVESRALEVAKKNAAYHHVKAEWMKADLFEGIEGSFDLIVSNPPYIPSGAIEHLAREVKDHEPLMALDGGADGLEIVRRIIAEAPDHLAPGGLLLMEIGDDQGAEVMALTVESGAYRQAEILKDLAGKDRILKAVKQ